MSLQHTLAKQILQTAITDVNRKIGSTDEDYSTLFVRAFMELYGQEHLTAPKFPLANVAKLRQKLVIEEPHEFNDWMHAYLQATTKERAFECLVHAYDALLDTLVVTFGSLLAFGFPYYHGYHEVAISNMSKMGEDGKPVRNEHGKIMKGPNFFPPEPKLAQLIESITGWDERFAEIENEGPVEKKELVIGEAVDSRGFVAQPYLIGTTWTHVKSNVLYKIIGFGWDSGRDAWQIQYQKADGTGIVYHHLIEDWFLGKASGTPRFVRVT